MNGFINLLKPAGMSSAYAVGAVKKKFNMPCGHMGTLDPMAEGVLPVGVGRASRLFQYLTEKRKSYKARFKFGLITDTLDTTGVTENTCAHIPSQEEIEGALGAFKGVIEQIPPRYSAKCVGGKRGYKLARQGVDFTPAPARVEVFDFYCIGKTGEDEYEFNIECGGGVYIRSLARDLAAACGSLAVMSALTRTRSGVFDYESGVKLEEFVQSISPEKYLIPPQNTLSYESVVLSKAQAERILNGIFDYRTEKGGLFKVFCEEEFWGVGEAAGGILKIKTYVR